MKRIVTIVFLGLVALVLLTANVVSIIKLTKVPDDCILYTLIIWLPGRIIDISALAKAYYNDGKAVVGNIFSLMVGLLFFPLFLLVCLRYGHYQPIMLLPGVALLQMMILSATSGKDHD